jgi:hypothetical protein
LEIYYGKDKETIEILRDSVYRLGGMQPDNVNLNDCQSQHELGTYLVSAFDGVTAFDWCSG